MKLAVRIAVFSLAIFALVLHPLSANAAKQHPGSRPAAGSAAGTAGGGTVYPQFLYQGKTTRWIPQQMPIKVWVSNGLSLDQIIDPATGAPVTNTANTAHWGDAVVAVLEQGKIGSLPQVTPFSEEMYQAAVRGVSSWKVLEPEGLYSYRLTDSPDEADVYVFWTNHFVNKLGLGLFENDIRGQTSKWLLPAQAVLSAMQENNLDLIRRSRKPVVILLRTTASDGQNMMGLRDMEAAAAHEMGHALGIDGHSQNPHDLMSVYYAQGAPYPKPGLNDLATMRYLYHRQAEMIP